MAADSLGNLNAAVLYLASLGSSNSRKTMGKVLELIAKMLKYRNHLEMPWEKMDRVHVFMELDALAKLGRSPKTRNLYLSAIKGVAREAYAAGQINAEHLERIRTVKRSSAKRLPAGRALPVEEISEMMDFCLTREGLTGLRDAAMLALMFGSGPRRSE